MTAQPKTLADLTAEIRRLHPTVHSQTAAAAQVIDRYESLVVQAAEAKGATAEEFASARSDAYMNASNDCEMFADGDPFEGQADQGAGWRAYVVEDAFRLLFPKKVA